MTWYLFKHGDNCTFTFCNESIFIQLVTGAVTSPHSLLVILLICLAIWTPLLVTTRFRVRPRPVSRSYVM